MKHTCVGWCAGFYAAQYLRKHKLATEGPRVRVTCEKVKDQVARMTNFVIEIDAPGELSKDQRKGLDQAVANASCTRLSRTRAKSR